MRDLSATVVVITVDRPDDVRRCLASFHGDLPATCDAVVVDASRTNDTEKVVGEFAGVRYLRSPVRNLCAQRNLGIRASDKNLVVFLDDDAIAQPGWLRELLASFDDPGIWAVGGAIHEEGLTLVPADSKPQMTANGPKQTITNWQTSEKTEVLNVEGGNMAIRREALLKIGGFDENLQRSRTGEAVEMSVRLRRAGGRILYNPQAAVQHCPGPTSSIYGYTRSSFDRRFLYWIGRNHAYSNTKNFFGRKEFFWYFFVHTFKFLLDQAVRLVKAIGSNLSVTAAHLLGKLVGFGVGLKWHLTQKGKS